MAAAKTTTKSQVKGTGKAVAEPKPPWTTGKGVELRTLKISYSVGCRVNLGNYEHADAHISRGEEWVVTGLTQAQVDEAYDERRAALKKQLDTLIEAEYQEMNGQEPEEDKNRG